MNLLENLLELKELDKILHNNKLYLLSKDIGLLQQEIIKFKENQLKDPKWQRLH